MDIKYTFWQMLHLCTSPKVIYQLEMLSSGLLEGVSHSFTKNFHLIDSAKGYLSYALFSASVS
ncbi:hypothetical protein Ahy_B04g072227 isoform A [Arachis hypogaea]|uniref:Uncharacterized protein n=1 Tax=Arachis hypogaea TaxID=3818 RepID=A0A444ZMY6_ARAHY|nr:hypothetical protein Ahy_B04g072227 isoform A [Arachis hypogaea]